MLKSIMTNVMTDIMTNMFGDASNVVTYTDNFTDTNDVNITEHISDSGFEWVTQTGFSPTQHAKIHNNKIYPRSNLNVYRADFVMPSADYEVEAVFSVITNTGLVGVTARASASANTFYTWSFLNNQFSLRKTVAGTLTTIGTYNQTLIAGQDVIVKIVCNGSTIQGYVDGVLRASATDTSITEAGSFGLRMPFSVTASTGIHVDSIVARLI